MAPLQAAHACHDVLAMIFEHLTPDPSDGSPKTEESRLSCRRALVSSARACTTLSHHALNVLWRELDTIHPLLKTLPNCELVDWQLTLCGAISDENWTRFQLYAGRVRAIVGTLESYDIDPIHPSIWLFLAARCKGSPLMPHLNDLVVMDLRTSETSGLVLLMSPSLRTLSISFTLEAEAKDRRNAPHVASSLLQTLPLMAPNLESFSYDVDISVSHGYIGAFSQFTRLKILSICSKLPLDEGALQMLFSIPTIQDLSCTIDLSDSESPLQPITCQRLTRLDLAGPFDDLIELMYTCQPPSLASVTLRIKEPPITGHFAESFAVVCERCNPNPALLTSFTIRISYEFDPPLPNRIMAYFEPVLAFPNIKHFTLWLSHDVPPIHDDDLAQFGAAWPRLSSFGVLQYGGRKSPLYEDVRPTLCGLIDLARRCPHLNSFQVPELDASVLPEKDAVLPLGHRMRSLSISDVVLPLPESPTHLDSVAGTLDRVFPSIDLKDARPVAGENAKGWDKVIGLMKTMRLGRKP